MNNEEEKELVTYFTRVVKQQLADNPNVLQRYEQEYRDIIEDITLGTIVSQDILLIYTLKLKIAKNLLKSSEGIFNN